MINEGLFALDDYVVSGTPLSKVAEKTKKIFLRPYQTECLQRVQAAFDRGLRRGLVVKATGLGKTTLFSELIRQAVAEGRKVLVIAHQIELLDQAADRIRSMCPGVKVGVQGGDHKAPWNSQVVVGGNQSLGRAKDPIPWFKPDLIVVDECFPAGTLVDGRPIESIKVGDEVDCYDHDQSKVVRRTVSGTFKSRPSAMARVLFADGRSICCTPGHPFFTQRGYLAAAFLLPGDEVPLRDGYISERTQNLDGSENEALVPMPKMRERHHGQDEVRERQSARRSALLLGGVQGVKAEGGELGADGTYEPRARFQADDRAQPISRSGNEEENLRFPQEGRPSSEAAEGQWVSDGPSNETGRGFGLEDRGDRENGRGQGEVRHAATKPLQARRRGSRTEDSGRDRRRQSHDLARSREGRSEATRSRTARVDRVEILEPGCDGTFGGVCPDGFVYNIEVKEHHNYFAEGLHVHNCHHAAAETYMIIFRRYRCWEPDGAQLLGVTATPHRLDNRPLHGTEKAIFEEVLYDMPLGRAIREGWLCDLRAYRVAASMDLRGIKKAGGDFNQKQLQERANNAADNELAFTSWKKEASDRRTIVFCTGVDHALEMAEVFRHHGVKAKALHGRMDPDVREQTMSDFRSGKIQVLTNMQLVTEGVDVPEAACVLLMRPTQSWSLFTQMVGRGVRTAAGLLDPLGEATPEERHAAIASSSKPDCVVIDVVGVTNDLSLASVPAILGMPVTDMEGGSAKEALRILDNMDEGVRAALFRRPTTFRGLSADLTKIDLLAELSVPEEAARATPFAWLKLGEGEYTLTCGSDDSESKRQARLRSDTLGAWTLRLTSDKRDELVNLSSYEVSDAFKEADRILRLEFPGVSVVANARAKWRSDPPTEKQVHLLRRFRVDEATIAALTKGQASAMLDKQFERKGAKR